MSGTSSESHIEAKLTLAFSAAPLVRVIVDSLPWHAHPTSNYCIPHRCLASWSPLELELIWGSNSPDLYAFFHFPAVVKFRPLTSR